MNALYQFLLINFFNINKGNLMKIHSNNIGKISNTHIGQRTVFLNKDLNGDTVSFSSNNYQNPTISDLKNQTARDFFSELYRKSPEKCEILLNNEEIKECCNSNCQFFSDEYQLLYSDAIDTIKQGIDKLDEKELEYVISSLGARIPTKGEHLFSGIVLYSNDKEAYEYIINSPKHTDPYVYSSGYSKDLCKYILGLSPDIVSGLSYSTIKEIEKGNLQDFDYSAYTSDSDTFLSKPDEVEKMSNFLRENKCEDDFVVYRGDKSTWMFDSIPLNDKSLEREIRLMLFLNPKSRKINVFPNNHKYANFSMQSMYDYFKGKKSLTLADAMLVAQFGSSRYISKVLEKINNAKIQDNNFKSYTLDKNFAKNWAKNKDTKNKDDMVSILTRTTICKGNEVGYATRSKQYEFILNNNQKQLTFSNASYDKDNNMFYIDTQVSV